MEKSIIKGVLHNKDGTVDYVFDNEVYEEVIKPFQLNYNTLYQIAWDLWSRDIKSTINLYDGGRNIIIQKYGKESLEIIDKILNTNWYKWEKDMEIYFSKQKVRSSIMEKVKLSTDTIVLVDGYSTIFEVSEILEDLDKFRHKKIYTTKEYNAKFNARDVLEDAIEYEYQNMYEDWNEQIWQEVTEQDINDLQVILDRILSRSSNIAYIEDKLVEIDL